MTNIVFFVSYLNYVTNWIEPLYSFLQAKGYNIVVFHMQSLCFGLFVNSEIADKYVAYDMGKMKIREIKQILAELNPKAVVFFDFKSFAQFIVLRITKHLGIRSIYIQHGLYNSNIFKYIQAKKKSSFLRYLFHFKQYFQLLGKHNIIKELKLAYKYFRQSDLINTKYDHAVVYSPYNLSVIQEKIRFEESKVKYSGYPITKFDDELLIKPKPHQFSKKKKILYLQQGFIPAYTHINYKMEHVYFKNIIDLCREYGFDFEIRLHPREDYELYKDMIKEERIIFDKENTLLDQISTSDLVVGHWSTAIFCAVLLNKPVIILFYPGFESSTDIFDEVALHARSYDEFENIIRSPKKWNTKLSLYEAFREKHIGKNNSYEHQANTLIKSIEN